MITVAHSSDDDALALHINDPSGLQITCLIPYTTEAFLRLQHIGEDIINIIHQSVNECE